MPSSEIDKLPPQAPKKNKKGRWWKIPLRILGILLLIIILIPVLLYVPPVQSLVKDLACSIVGKSTGMQLEIGHFGLKFPLDVQLDDVLMMPAPGDTMVAAKSLTADVKMLPLLKLDVQINKLELEQARLRILSADSSMDMRIRAGILRVAEGSSANIKTGLIDLHDAYLRDADVNLDMDVWKKQPTPTDTTATQFIIRADRLKVDNFGFGMAMLPTIDTLSLVSRSLEITGADINLVNNTIKAKSLIGDTGNFTYLTPTQEYINSHPAPIDTTSAAENTPPMVITGNKVALTGFKVLYAVKGASPLPGFDPSYISLSDLNVELKDFRNAAVDITAPIQRLEGKERSGLNITSGTGVFSMDSTGMALSDLKVRTPFSRLNVSAKIPNALMALQPQAMVDVDADVSLGMPDINSFMPDLKKYTTPIGNAPLNAKLIAKGALDDVVVPQLDVALPGILSLRAAGKARNALDFKKLIADLQFDGEISRPSTVEKIAGPLGFDLPALKLKGTASANAQTYGADFNLLTTDGNVAGKGSVGLTSERYHANLDVKNLNVAKFVKDLGIGNVTASLKAEGAGFNPEKSGAKTDINLHVAEIVYNNHPLRNITAEIGLHQGVYSLDLQSANSALDGYISGHGTVAPDLYTFDVDLDIRHVDLQELGLSPTPNGGAAVASIKGTASPAKWNYDADVDIKSVDWTLDQAQYTIPSVALDFLSDNVQTRADIKAEGTELTFNSPRNLKVLMDSINVATAGLSEQLKNRIIDVGFIQSKLPPFRLTANASGTGLVQGLLGPSGMSLDTLYAVLGKDSLVNGDITIAKLNTGSMTLDDINLQLKQRQDLLDYRLKLTNGPGPMAEFADVSLSGYLGLNRISAYLNQHNIKGEQGYRLGFTAALADSIATLHFTPLKATIAYRPWTFNLDNFVSYKLSDHAIQAYLLASSDQSSIMLKTEDAASGDGTDLHLNLTDIKVQDFLQMSPSAPPLTATVNSDIRLHYTGKMLEGKGSLGLTGLSYDRVKIQDLNLALNAGLNPSGDSRVDASLTAGGRPALSAMALLGVDTVAGTGLQPKEMNLTFDGLPLDLANPFIGVQTASLSGKLRGGCDIRLSRAEGLRLNGALSFDSVGIYLPIMATTLRLDNDPIEVKDNIITFSDFNIWGVNNNPLSINGTVNATKFSNIGLDLTAAANNFQVVGTNRNSPRSDISGKLFMNLDSRVRGTLSLMDISATATVLNTTDVVYTMNEVASNLTANSAEGIVKFVNLQDTTAVVKADSILTPPMAMRVNATLTLQQGMQVLVNLDASGSKVDVQPSGTLSYFQNYMGDMKLNGELFTGQGLVKYTLPVVGIAKTFNFDPESSITWTGDIMNPRLHIMAYDPVKANVAMSGQAQLVDFKVALNVNGSLSAPQVLFDLSTDNDMSIQNELQGMTADQRSATAMNMLITGQYTGTGAKNVGGNFVTGNLYNWMASQLNSWAAENIKGVDLSFGVNQYETGDINDTQTNTSYSYQVSKSLFNNKFKIIVGGNYSTDASADENFEQNLISDISFEYMLKQTNNYNILARLFRHTGFESILEGEITETGVGLAYRRRLSNLRSFFRFRRNRKNKAMEEIPDTVSKVAPADTTSVMDLAPAKINHNLGKDEK